ncbi:hypothetical protein KD33_04155 [Clostridium sp. NCR]|nr:hypothetical protein KD33_04155 [Clostridium sp. NCR]
MKKAIAFDFDGTLLDSKFRHQKVLFDILKEEDIDIELDELDDFVQYKAKGQNTESYLKEKYKDKIGISKVVDKWICNIENMEYLDLDKLYEGSRELLSDLNNLYDLYLVTARSNKVNSLEQIKKQGILKYFKKVFVVANDGNCAFNKYNKTKDLGIVTVIGDTEVDLEWAKYLDVNFLPVIHGFRDSIWWRDKNIETYQDLENIRCKLLDK